jgi:hypothetical protein
MLSKVILIALLAGATAKANGSHLKNEIYAAPTCPDKYESNPTASIGDKASWNMDVRHNWSLEW